MTRILLFATLGLMAGLTPALAEVTARQVWDAWISTASDSGNSLSAIERETAEGLFLSDVRFKTAGPEGATFRIEEITLLQQQDGSVSVRLPAAFPLEITPAQPVGILAVNLDVSLTDFSATVRGLGDALDFDLGATAATAELDETSIRRNAAEGEEDIYLAVALADLDMLWRQQITTFPKDVDGALGLGTLHIEAQIRGQDGLTANVALDLSAVDLALRGMMPIDLGSQETGTQGGPAEFLRALEAGFAFRAEGRHGPFALLIDGVDPVDGPLFIDLGIAGGEQVMALDRTGAVYRSFLGASHIKAALNDPASPMRNLDASFSEFLLEGTTDLGDLVSRQDWGAAFRLTGLTMPDQVWTGFDPGAVLPRDPLSLVVGLSGTWALDPAALLPGWTAPSNGAFQALSVLTAALDELRIEGLGARLTGTGALSFDMADTVTYDGMPAPSGTLSFAASGLNGLIDRLASIGALTEDEITGARFALLFIGKAGATPDSLTTEVILDGASITLNGQKMR